MTISYKQTLRFGRFETHSEKPAMDFLEAKQVHGTDLVAPSSLPCEADGLVVMWKDYDKPLAIKTADCMPIVIEGELGVVALHAGWKGLASGILKRPEIAGVRPRRAFIGPSIQACCFEVSEDFRSNFPGSMHFKSREEKFFFNLQLEARDQLKFLYPEMPVDMSPLCTHCIKGFHSYRREKQLPLKERNWNLYIKG